MTIIVDSEKLPAISWRTNFGVIAKYKGPPSIWAGTSLPAS
jgi:hypothetical protein